MSTLERWRRWWEGPPRAGWDLLFLALLGMAILWPALGVSLLGDDWIYWGAAHGPGGFLDVGGGATRPVGSAALVLLLGSLDGAPALLGAIRIGHHVLNALLVLSVASRVFRLRAATSRLAAVAFLVWATQAEIFWHSTLHDALAATFALGALRLSAAPARIGSVLGLGACALGAYLSKESTWVLPVLLLGVWALRDGPRRLWPVLVTITMLGAAIGLRVAWAGGVWVDMGAPVVAGLSAGQVAASVIKLVFRSVVPGWISGQELVPLLKPAAVGLVAALVGLSALTLVWRRTRRWWAVNLRGPAVLVPLCYLVSLAPVATLSVSAADTQNVRYLTLPTVFIALGFAVLAGPAGILRRVRGIVLLGVLFFQAGSLTYLGTTWMRASTLMERYRPALAELARSHPRARAFYLLCVPDTFRGAYVARNASRPLIRSGTEARDAVVTDVVAVTLARDVPGELCRLERRAGELTLVATASGARLTHPDFHRGRNPARAGPWRIQASHLRHAHARSVRLRLEEALPAGSVVALYGAGRFRPVRPPR